MRTTIKMSLVHPDKRDVAMGWLETTLNIAAIDALPHSDDVSVDVNDYDARLIAFFNTALGFTQPPTE